MNILSASVKDTLRSEFCCSDNIYLYQALRYNFLLRCANSRYTVKMLLRRQLVLHKSTGRTSGVKLAYCNTPHCRVLCPGGRCINSHFSYSALSDTVNLPRTFQCEFLFVFCLGVSWLSQPKFVPARCDILELVVT